MRRVLAATVAAGLAAVLWWPAGARAQASVIEVGWWSDNPLAAPPEGGVQVAQGPQGAISVAAVRIDVGEPAPTLATLLLQEAQVVGTPRLQVCPTADAWTAGANQGGRPSPACPASPVLLQRDEVQQSWSVDVLPFLGAGGQVSVMVVPAPDPSVPLPVPFQADFGAAFLQSDAQSEPVATPGGPTGEEGLVVPTDPGTGAFDAPAFGGPADLDLPAPSALPDLNVAQSPAAAAPAQVEGQFPTRQAVGEGAGANTPWGRTPVLLLAAVAVGAATAFARQRLRQLGWLPAS